MQVQGVQPSHMLWIMHYALFLHPHNIYIYIAIFITSPFTQGNHGMPLPLGGGTTMGYGMMAYTAYNQNQGMLVH